MIYESNILCSDLFVFIKKESLIKKKNKEPRNKGESQSRFHILQNFSSDLSRFPLPISHLLPLL